MPRFADVREGDDLAQVRFSTDLATVIRFCGLGWTFPALFYDVDAARAQGMPGTLVPGPLKLGFLYQYAAEWAGSSGWVRHVRAAHRRPDITGRPVTVAGRVARVYSEGDANRADLELAVLNEDGQPSTRGFATIEFTA